MTPALLDHKGRSVPCGDGWIDDDTVLCDAEDRFGALGLAPGAKPGAPVVPENDHRNEVMVISSDGQRFVFLWGKGTTREHYVCDTAPGSTPKKVERRDGHRGT
ncbi:hypothetical protein FE391_30435 [Nonomuraea sp. KC401]|uniref:hypothetical protein n=1 Tax=unclassified Nonomuraea TaxID=2593643 RepID=UPI0010FD21D6|nr:MULTISPECIES: hypothetical protein [unclassified Nonomuraea]NBE97205.1 hypothetical protein [Nonomuraea sp. K271]TLF62337.1 hypothetical protein FE391_30435 [Nonomuraea sp. KC401]